MVWLAIKSCLVQEFPTVVDGGQDAASEEAQVVQEEFDLSDIMGEQLDAQLGTKEDRLRQLAEQVCNLFHSRCKTAVCWLQV